MTKRNEPNVLDRLFNVTASARDVKRMVDREAKRLVEEAFEENYCERSARQMVSDKLTVWVTERGLSGRGRKTMVDKAVAKHIKGYELKLKLYLLEKASVLAKSGNWLDEHRAQRIRDDIRDGRIGKETYRGFPMSR